MKKITTLLAACLITSAGFSQSTDREWEGGESEKIWNYSITNWVDPTDDFFPTTFDSGLRAIFSDRVFDGAETVTVEGEMVTSGVLFKASKDIKIIRATTSNYTTDVIKGDGTLVKEGTGTFSLAVENELTGGSIVREGILRMEEASLKDKLYNPFGAKVVLEGGTVDLATGKSKSGDAEYVRTSPVIEIPEGKSGKVMMAAYTYFSGAFKGAGDLTLALEGERGYIQNRPASNGMSDWSEYTGKNINIEYIENTQGKAGLVVFGTTKTFDPESSTYEGAEVTFADKSITLGAKAGIAMESGTTAWVIGELKADDETAQIMGYRSKSNGPRPYWIVGGLNTDVVLKARFVSPSSENYNANAFIKVGTGTYTFTNNNSLIQVVGLQVHEGKVLACDDVLRGQYSGSIGGNVLVKANGAFGGTGRVQTHGNNGVVNVYGKLEPGANGIGTLMISDSLAVNPLSKYETPFSYSVTYQILKDGVPTDKTYTYKNGGTNKQHLNLYPGSVTEIELKDANTHDKLDIRGNLRFYTDGGKAKIKVTIPGSYVINDGDEFEIFTAYSCTNADNEEADYFDIEYPTISGVTWSKDIIYEDLDTEVFNFVDKFDDDINAGQEYPTEVTLTNKRYRIIVKATGSASGIESEPSVSDVIAVYPNPTYGEVKVSGNDVEISAIEIYSIQGQLVKSQAANGNEATLQVNEIPSGVYVIKVYTSNGVVVQKLVKK